MATTYTTVPKQQVFRVRLTGLKPLTTHIFYFDGLARSQDCQPVYTDAAWGTYNPPPNILGSPLVTDTQGKLSFDFFFTPAVADNIDALKNLNNSFIGDKKFEVRATGSTGSKIVPITKSTTTSTTSSSSNTSTLSFTGSLTVTSGRN